MNQLLEIRRDALMRRTCGRPLPAGQVSRLQAMLFAVVASAAGVGILLELVNPLTALLGLANIVIYSLVYTPLKPRTSLCTLVGAVCGGPAANHGLDGGCEQHLAGRGAAGHDLVSLANSPLPGPGLDVPRRLCQGRLSHVAADRSPRPSDLPDDRVVLPGPAAHGAGGDIRRAGRISVRRSLSAAGAGTVSAGRAASPHEDAAERPPGLSGQSRLSSAADVVPGSRQAAASGAVAPIVVAEARAATR